MTSFNSPPRLTGNRGRIDRRAAALLPQRTPCGGGVICAVEVNRQTRSETRPPPNQVFCLMSAFKRCLSLKTTRQRPVEVAAALPSPVALHQYLSRSSGVTLPDSGGPAPRAGRRWAHVRVALAHLPASSEGTSETPISCGSNARIAPEGEEGDLPGFCRR